MTTSRSPRVFVRIFVFLLSLASVSACFGSDVSPRTAGPDASPPGDGDSGDGDTDGGSNVPRDPVPGDLIDFRVIEGAGSRAVAVAAPDGGMFVAADHQGRVSVDDIDLPAPDGSGFVALRLLPEGEAAWARAFAATERLSLRGAAAAPNGDLIVVGRFDGRIVLGETVLETGELSGFAVRLRANDGQPLWIHQLEGECGTIDSVAVAPAGDVYVYGNRGCTALLSRWSSDGVLQWEVPIPGARAGSVGGSLVLDAAGRPVVAGRFSESVQFGDRRLEVDPASDSSDWFVAAFEHNGAVGFAQHIATEEFVVRAKLVATREGVLFAAPFGLGGGSVYVDGQFVHSVENEEEMFVLTLSSDGSLSSVDRFHSGGPLSPEVIVPSADGGVTLVASCSGDIVSVPNISCPEGWNAVLIDMHPSARFPRWSATLASIDRRRNMRRDAVVTVDNTVKVIGELHGEGHFGGRTVAGNGLFIATFMAGAPLAPELDGPAPDIEAVQFEGNSSRQIRQGATAELLVSGSGFSAVHSAAVGDRPAPVRVVDDENAIVTVRIPHGQPPVHLAVELFSAGGNAVVEDAIEVTFVTVAPDAPNDGPGTPDAPMGLCQHFSVLLKGGATVRLSPGEYDDCNYTLYLQRGTTFEGTRDADAVLSGDLAIVPGFAGTTTVRNLSIEPRGDAAVQIYLGRAEINDVTVRSGYSGVYAFAEARVDISGLDYEGFGWGLWIMQEASVTADNIHIASESTGVLVDDGELSLSNSEIRAHFGEALRLSNAPGPRKITLGVSGVSGNNLLESHDDVALRDLRETGATPIDAHGTTLNGESFDGPVLGPVLLPGVLDLRGPTEIRF